MESRENGRRKRPGRFIPPVEFPVFGIDTWEGGRRSLDTFQGPAGESPTEVWLGHVAPDGHTGVSVGTIRRTRALGDPVDDDPATVSSAVAARGAASLIDLTIPLEPRPKQTKDIVSLLDDHARVQAANYRSWPEASWRVDGVEAVAHVWNFAGAWTGFTAVSPDVFIAVVGVGIDPCGLQLRHVDGSDYGVDLTRPLDRLRPELQDREWWETILPRPNRNGYLPEQLALLPRT